MHEHEIKIWTGIKEIENGKTIEKTKSKAGSLSTLIKLIKL